MRKYKKIFTAVCCCAGIFMSFAGLTNAFLSKSTNILDNAVTPGTIKVSLSEPLWKRENAENLVPGQVISKNPIVTNIGGNDSWVFLRVDVPVKYVAFIDEKTKKKTKKMNTELLTFDVDDRVWELVERTTDADAVHYVYGFREVLKAGASTEPLFHNVAIINYLEGEIDSKEILEMPIEAAAIQCNLENEDGGLQLIYQEYLREEAMDREAA